ncbi:ribonuclease Z [Thermoflavimicrobium dichotomicum]|uniref:Ribonuclease Z n=1 Tax=Thermoflavimicrobium dichotomicum TaxID=46223 RepID=A0A1I3LKV3_9BACL|nr:ribonuclease Z [Thermoflavimicrobium dichotomicum]SFI85362.1 ribonuclease Z [Thermoflavimicrobium dichotomicum]
MNFYFLGTGAGIPSKTRNVSAAALLLPEYHGDIWLFDCGEATQHQILSTPIKLSKISRIFITHLHGDHLYGLPGVLGSRSFQGAESPLTVYGPKGIRRFIDVTLETSHTYLKYPLHVVEIDDGMTWEEPHFSIFVRLLEHGIPSYGYRLMEKDQPGSLQVERLKSLGIPPGPHYKELKQGKVITFPNGQTLDGKEFVSPPKKGKKMAVLGDTKFTPVAIELAKDVDLLVHESTYRKGLEDRAETYFHSTNVQAAEIARTAQAKNLILTHISTRFDEEACKALLAEAQEIFPNTWLAYDGFQFTLT